MRQLGSFGAGSRRNVPLFNERNFKSAERRIPCNGASIDSPANNDDVKGCG